MGSSIVTIIIAIGLILFSLYKTFRLVQQILKKAKSETWQVARAQVVSKQVVKKRSSRSGSSYFPEIEYQYSVMGQSFENKVRLPKNYTRGKAEEKLDGVGMSMEVRYDPNQPKEHISEYEFVNYADIILIVLSVVLAGFMLYPFLLK
jgi:predicted Holliday junction resolvase-like endonuclease